MIGPSFQNLPLNNFPYNSRVAVDPTKYQMVAFKPGYPLQNSELNEIQDMIYIQQSLTAMMWSNWCTYKVATSVNSTGPGWEGATPLYPSLITLGTNILTVGEGWYLCKLQLSGFYLWLYNKTSTNISILTTQENEYVGFSVSSQGVDAQGNITNTGGFVTCRQDQSLRFNDGGSIGPCGADRYKVELTSIGVNSEGYSSTFVPIMVKRVDGMYFMNNTKVGTV